MDRAKLGRTGLDVSVACLGTGGKSALGQMYGKSFEHSVNLVKAAMDQGIDFIDTSVSYGTEEIVGAAVKGKRDKVVIATKNHIVKKGTSFTGTDFVDAAEYRTQMEENLQRIGTDYIDIFHAHGICEHQYDYCIKEILPVLQRMREEGKIRFIAISERFNIETRHQMLSRAVQDDHFDVMMVGFNFVNHTALRHVLPAAKKKNVGIQAIYAVRGGLATLEAANKLIAQAIASGEVDPGDLDPKEPLGFLLTEGGASSLPNACYRFCRHTPGADTILTGTGSIEHLTANIKSINDKPLPKPVVDKLLRIFARVESVTAD